METVELYASKPVRTAVLSMVVPTVVSQLITVVYNMADTFFIGQLNDPVQVAAATVSMPPFVFLTGIANLFGIGSASLMSRSLGKNDIKGANESASFAFWTAASAALVYGLAFLFLRPWILPLLGATEETSAYVYQYVVWTVTLGAIPTVMNTVLAHLVRAIGDAKHASLGLTLGGALNIVLDPLFIFGFHMNIEGAAIATFLSNVIALFYFLILLYIKKKHSFLSVSPANYPKHGSVPKEVIMTGLPSFIMTFMSFFSNVVLNYLISRYSSNAIAGMGIAKKVDMIGFAIAQGMTQGVLPLIGFNYATGNKKRLKEVVRTTLLYSVGMAVISSVLLFIFPEQIAGLFIEDKETIDYASGFIRTLCLSLATSSVTMMIITIFQATGEKKKPMVLSLLRKGGLDVPFMILFHYTVGIYGIAWATPIADVSTMTIAICLFVPFWKVQGSQKQDSSCMQVDSV